MKTFLLFLVSTALLAQHTPQNEKNPLAGDVASAIAGQKTYTQVCQGCHGGEGKGDRAPALAGGKFRHGGADGELFLSIRSGVRGTQMPAFSQFSAERTWQLVSYIRTLSAAPVAGEKVAGDVKQGESVFNGKGQCNSCHIVNGRGVAVGPDLSAVGTTPAAMLESMILFPNPDPKRRRRVSEGKPPSTVIAKTSDGVEHRGVLKNEDTFSIQMVDTGGRLLLLDKSNPDTIRVEKHSIMPDDFGRRLSAGEVKNLVSYLKTLTGGAPILRSESTGGLTYERIVNAKAEPQNWLTYWGDYTGRHYSTLNQINAGNVGQLQSRWAVQMPGDGIVESVPLVVDGVMYTAGPPGQVFALDAKTGRRIWKFQRPQKVVNPYESNRVNRGVAMLGNRLFFGTLDGALIALDARTGQAIWEVQVADTKLGFSITAAPLVVKDKIVTGVAGGEYGANGFIDAYDPATGKRLWRFNTIPGTGEFGNNTWHADSWKQGGGATWMTGTYDPELNLLYWGVGNPGPDMDGDVRKGDDLFTCSVVALDGDTGKRKWHYQFTPNDTHDWDATETPVLVDREYRGQKRKLMMQANRNGVFYVLDRTNGEFLFASPFVRASWVKSWDEKGRPILAPNSRSSAEGNLVYPSLIGGTNFQAPSYDPITGWFFVEYHDGGANYVRTLTPLEPGKQYWGGRAGAAPQGDPDTQGVAAIDPETGKIQWKFELAQASLAAGVLATAGGVVFTASQEGNFIALDAKTGKALWHFGAGAEIPSSPMSYSVDGKQFVAVSSAGVLYSFALPE